MDNVRKVSDELSAGGQLTSEELQQAVAEGFKSVVNLRSPEEAGFHSNEQQEAEAVGLQYVNVPLKPTEAGDGLTGKVLEEIEGLPGPVLLHCAAGSRASALALIALANREKLSREQVLQKAQELGLNLEQPHLKQFLGE